MTQSGTGFLRHAIGLFVASIALATLFAPRLALAAPEETKEPTETTEPAKSSAEPAKSPADAPASPAPASEPAAPPAAPKAKAPAATAQERAAPSKTIRFNFHYQGWKDVLDFFADRAGYSLVADSLPPGTFNYQDSREYTPAEALDIINSVLQTKGYTLVRRDRMLMLINLQDPVPPNLIPFVSLDELATRGKSELVSVIFRVTKMSPEEAEAEVKKLVGQQGIVVNLPKAGQIVVTDTAARLLMIRSMLDAVESPQGPGGENVRAFTLEHAPPFDALSVVKQLMNVPADKFATSDGSFRVAIDSAGRLLATGKADALAKVDEIVKSIDVPSRSGASIEQSPQLEVYQVTSADPASVLQVLQTLLAGAPDVRLALDPKTGALIAQGRPAQQATIRATIDQMQRDAKKTEAIPLRTLDPQVAVAAITKLFATEGDAAPKVEAEPITRQVLVRGSEAQIAQIRSLLAQMGETEMGGVGADNRTVRTLVVPERTAREALDKIGKIWPTLHQNKIRIVTPSAISPSMKDDSSRRQFRIEEPSTAPQAPAKIDDARRESKPRVRVMLAQLAREAEPVDASAAPEAPASEETEETSDEFPEIIVAPGPGGITIACKDPKALDEFENLLTTLTGRGAGSREFAVYYLKYSKAAVVGELLATILSGSSGGSFSVGSFLGLGGAPATSATAAPPEIIPDARLNALIVQATPAQLDFIDRILQILDQQNGPEEVLISARPRLIPVFNTSAEAMSTVVKQVYQDRIGPAQNNQRRGGGGGGPGPEMLMRMFAGGGGGGQPEEGRRGEADAQRMTIGVDPRTNSLVVSAPDALFEEVELLVKQLDQTQRAEAGESMKVVTLKRANPESVKKALDAIVGISKTARPIEGGEGQGSRGEGGGDARRFEEMRRRFEFFNDMQRGGRGGGRGGGGDRDRGDRDRGR